LLSRNSPASFLGRVHAGDTLYPALEIVELEREGDDGFVTTAISVFNQRKELVLSGHHKYLLNLVATSIAK